MTAQQTDFYANPGEETEGTVYTAMGGGDFADIAREQADLNDETLVINMGPQHPSTHGVLRLMVE
jgi:NADH-quinone oxidoreductase subunit D